MKERNGTKKDLLIIIDNLFVEFNGFFLSVYQVLRKRNIIRLRSVFAHIIDSVLFCAHHSLFSHLYCLFFCHRFGVYADYYICSDRQNGVDQTVSHVCGETFEYHRLTKSLIEYKAFIVYLNIGTDLFFEGFALVYSGFVIEVKRGLFTFPVCRCCK